VAGLRIAFGIAMGTEAITLDKFVRGPGWHAECCGWVLASQFASRVTILPPETIIQFQETEFSLQMVFVPVCGVFLETVDDSLTLRNIGTETKPEIPRAKEESC
jgi:hypothetical protein